MAMLIASCSTVPQEPKSDELGALLARAKAQGLVTSIEEIQASIKPSEKNSAPLYAALASPPGESSPVLRDLYDFLRGRVSLKEAAAALENLGDTAGKFEAAAALPDYAPERDWHDPIGMTLPEMAVMKNAAKLLTGRAAIRAAQSNKAGALADIELAANVVRHAGEERMLIGALVQAALISIWTSSILLLTEEFSSDEEALKRLSGHARNVKEPSFKEFLGYEIVLDREIIRQVKSGDISATQLMSSPFGDIGEKLDFFDKAFAARADKAELILVEHLVNLAEVWGDSKRVSEVADAFDKRVDNNRLDAAYLLANRLMPVIETAHDREKLTVADVRTARIGVAAAYLRAKSGRWPALNEAAEQAGVTPNDPYPPGRLLYKPTEKSLLIYSVGPNGKDDGGVKYTRENWINFDAGVFRITLK